MTLEEVNLKLAEVGSELEIKIPAFQEAEFRYNLRFWDLLIHSGMGNQGAREAEANLTCNVEGLLEPVQILRGEVRALYHKKDCYIAIAANLRALQVGDKKEDIPF